MQTAQSVIVFALYPAAAVMAGGGIALWRTMPPRLISAVQHFAAGVLFCALSTELLPDLVHRKMPWVTLLGFTLGVIVMLLVKHFAENLGQKGLIKSQQPTSLIVILGLDIALDGLLIGLGFAAGQKQGLLLTIALTLEVLFLGLSGGAALQSSGASRKRVLFITLGFALTLITGAWAGQTLLAGASDLLLDAVLAFGLAALLYLVTEELLVEAHEVPETSAQTAMFFVGFILLLTIEMFI
ncbi:MAG: ZIP family metal transporter [Methylotenera sp.]|nr:ZIP family metal transporter [Methylotenera sp.]